MAPGKRSDTPGPTRPGLSPWKKGLFAVVVLALFFTGLEILLLALGVTPVLYDEDPYVGFSSYLPLFVEEPSEDGETALVTARNKERFFNPQRFPRDHGSDTFRIFCMGGSTTYGRPYRDSTSFCGWLRELLPVADPSRQWEVINAGGVSYASYRVALLMEELRDYDPDLFIIYSGHNEFLERRTYSQIATTPTGVRELRALLSHTRTYALLGRLIGGARSHRSGATRLSSGEERELLPAEVEAVLDDTVGPSSYTRDDSLTAQVLAHYRYNLARMVKIARSAGARVILVTPASNLRDCSPFKSEHGVALDAPERRRWQQFLDGAREANSAERRDEALRMIDEAVKIDDRHAQAHYFRGRILNGLGRHDEAREVFVRARDEDVCPLRALSSMREIVAEVVADGAIAHVDFIAVLEPLSRQNVLGEDFFLDHVHPTITGNRVLALALVAEMVQQGFVSPAASWGEAVIDDVVKRVEGGLDRQSHAIALKNLAKVFGWAGKFEEAQKVGERAAAIITDDAEAQFTLGVAYQRQGNLDDAVKQYMRTVKIEPGYVEAYKNLGRIREIRKDLAGAEVFYRKALSIRNDHAETLAALGNVLARRGDVDTAISFLEKAASLDSQNAEIQQKLGVVHLGQKNHQKARAHLERALEIQPDFSLAHHNLGLVFLEEKNFEKAVLHYREAIRIKPEYSLAHESLGTAHANLGEIVPALDSFARALRLDPGTVGVRHKLEVMGGRFRAALQRQPRNPEARYYLGLVLAAEGETVQAIDQLRRALEFARSRDLAKLAGEIRQRLERLERDSQG